MAAFKQVTFMLLVIWFQSLRCISARRAAKNGIKAQQNGPNDLEITSVDHIVKAIDFAREQINVARNMMNCSSYKEQVNEVISFESKTLHGDDEVFELKLRLNESDCKMKDLHCEPKFDAAMLFQPPEEEVVINSPLTLYPPDAPATTRLVAPLDTPMYSGKKIEILGTVPKNSRGFHVTLQTGHEIPVEAQLRINVKFNTPKGDIIQLEYYTGTWKLCSHHEGFIKSGQNFRIVIISLGQKFEVYANDMLMEKKCHPVKNFQESTHLSIIGHVSVDQVTGIGRLLPAENTKPPLPWLDDIVHYQEKPYVPFIAPLAPHLVVERTIVVIGSIPEDSVEFDIIIQKGNELYPEQVHLRLMATFGANDENTFTLSYRDGSWKDKQIADPVLLPGRAFHIAITCHADHFTITVDQKYSVKYHHQLPYQQATHLSVVGMVTIDEVVGIDELPFIQFLDRPTDFPLDFSVEDWPLMPGRKLKVWADFSDEGEEFELHLESAARDLIPLYMKFAFPSTGPYFAYNWYVKGEWGSEHRFEDLPWLQNRHPIQFEIECTRSGFQVTFYGSWFFTFDYRVAPDEIQRVNFKSYGWLISAIDGISRPVPSPSPGPPGPPVRPDSDPCLSATPGCIPLPPLPPELPPSPSRVCSMNVLVRRENEMWLNGLVCKPEGRIVG